VFLYNKATTIFFGICMYCVPYVLSTHFRGSTQRVCVQLYAVCNGSV